MTKTNFYFLLVICTAISMMFSSQTDAQSENTICGTTEYMEYLKNKRPNLEQELQQAEAIMQQWISSNPTLRLGGLTDTIPVVVHVVWKTNGQNISDTQVKNTILALNQDYGRTAPDTGNTPAVWKPIAASTGIQFCLAKRDPFGAPTNGIERRQTTNGPFTTNDLVKSFSTGGLDAWDVSRYFNIWICDLTPGLGGYGEFPTANFSNTFGNVTDYAMVGLTGWVATHECGHCFNLYHIWGDDGGTCGGSDLVGDTPNQANATGSTCPIFPALDACQIDSPGIMFMNYMDYGSNACKNIFTQGQASRIQAAIQSLVYASLLTSNGCDSVILQQTDAGIQAIVSPDDLICTTSIVPVVRLRNWGTDSLYSVTINYQLDAGPLQTLSWTGQLPSLAIADISLPAISVNGGSHTFLSYTTNPNGLAAGNAFNDTASNTFTVVLIGQAIPFSYGFEPAAFPPTGWKLENPDGSLTWARTTGAAKNGTASMWFNSINYTCNGCVDIITLPNLDLTAIGPAELTFQVAYRMLSDPTLSPNWSDSLRVDISNDCGLTWTNLYFNYSTNLTTIVPPFSTTAFVPTSNDWRLETIDLSPYAADDNVLFRFKVSSDYENNLYIDDINIDLITGTEELKNDLSFSVYPNPASSFVQVVIKRNLNEPIHGTIFSFDGKLVKSFVLPATSTTVQLDLSSFAKGVYAIKLTDDKNVFFKTIIKQ